MGAIKTCEEYVLLQLQEKENEIAELKTQVKAKDLAIEELKNCNESAKKLLRLLNLNLHEPTYATDWDGKIIDCDFILPTDKERYAKAMELIKEIFDLEEITRS